MQQKGKLKSATKQSQQQSQQQSSLPQQNVAQAGLAALKPAKGPKTPVKPPPPVPSKQPTSSIGQTGVFTSQPAAQGATTTFGAQVKRFLHTPANLTSYRNTSTLTATNAPGTFQLIPPNIMQAMQSAKYAAKTLGKAPPVAVNVVNNFMHLTGSSKTYTQYASSTSGEIDVQGQDPAQITTLLASKPGSYIIVDKNSDLFRKLATTSTLSTVVHQQTTQRDPRVDEPFVHFANVFGVDNSDQLFGEPFSVIGISFYEKAPSGAAEPISKDAASDMVILAILAANDAGLKHGMISIDDIPTAVVGKALTHETEGLYETFEVVMDPNAPPPGTTRAAPLRTAMSVLTGWFGKLGIVP